MSAQWISRDDVFAALDMNAVLKHYGITPGRGSSFRINCPFHEDDRPSCSINPEAKVFNCFACGTQGNVLDFIADMEELDSSSEFRAVLETAIDIIGFNPTRGRNRARNNNLQSGSSSERNEDDEPTREVVSEDVEQAPIPNPRKKAQPRKKSADRQGENSGDLKPNKVLEAPAFPLKLEPRHPYLEARGYSKSLLEKFGIGYEGRGNALMAGRICFPIHNAKGQLVAYGGRWADDENFVDAKGRTQDRYKLPSGFRKQLELYNLHRVLEEFPETTGLIVVEGFWSVLRLHSLNIPAVGLMGRSVSAPQIDLLKQHGFEQIVLMLDGDEEGRQATESMLPQLAAHFFVRDANLADDQKPDDVDDSILIANSALLTCQPTFSGRRNDPKSAPKSPNPAMNTGAIPRSNSGKSHVPANQVPIGSLSTSLKTTLTPKQTR